MYEQKPPRRALDNCMAGRKPKDCRSAQSTQASEFSGTKLSPIMGDRNRRGTDPFARWCERTGEATPPPTRSCFVPGVVAFAFEGVVHKPALQSIQGGIEVRR